MVVVTVMLRRRCLRYRLVAGAMFIGQNHNLKLLTLLAMFFSSTDEEK